MDEAMGQPTNPNCRILPINTANSPDLNGAFSSRPELVGVGEEIGTQHPRVFAPKGIKPANKGAYHLPTAGVCPSTVFFDSNKVQRSSRILARRADHRPAQCEGRI